MPTCAPHPALRRILAALAAFATVALAGCAASVHFSTLPGARVPRSAGDQLLLEPEHGIGAVYTVLRSPRQRLDLTMYELDDTTAEAILAGDADRGVRVRVILDQNLEKRHNQKAFDYLRGHGVHVVWANRRYAATHEKTAIVDGALAAVLSLNLTSRYYPNTRDVGVLTTDPADVAAISAVFDADFRGADVRPPPSDDLIWSPGAEDALVALVDSARVNVAVETEVFTDARVVDALVRAARRGVRVAVTMTYQKDWAANFTRVTHAGAAVSVLHGEHPLYIHAKVIVADAGEPGARAYLGSQNLSVASLTRNRELGVVLTAPGQVAALSAVLSADAARGERWTG